MYKWIGILLLISFFSGCSAEESEEPFAPTPLELQVPDLFRDKLIAPLIPVTNPMTVEGVDLGRRLFFDTLLSEDNTQSCASCHAPENAFTDTDQFSDGVAGIFGSRNSMPLFNLAWNFDERFTWDGKEITLERQAFEPVTNPIELHNNWNDVVLALQNHPQYPDLFEKAFGSRTIDSSLVTRAIAQFERTLISGDSRFDKHLRNELTLTSAELEGFTIFMDENRGDCFHCHGSDNNPLWTDNSFHNNGLDESFTDLGLGAVTGDPSDNGKFKTPSLRNLKFTAPFMHDGRFATLDEVIDHYSEGLKHSPTIDPLMKKVDQGGVQLSEEDKANLKAFLLSLSDDAFISNVDFQKP